MATLLIRNLDDAVKERLRARARANGRSLEAEAREVLAASVPGANEPDESGWASRLVAETRHLALSEEEWQKFNAELRRVRKQPWRRDGFKE
jgi:plasmid stability protein